MNRDLQPSGFPQESRATPAARRERIAWLDLFRGAAVLVMIETHVVNTFLATAVRAESWFAILNYLNGLVAPSFLFIAGFVQGMERSPLPKADAGPAAAGASPPLAPPKPVHFARRARRLLGIGLIGYALHFPWTELVQQRWDAALRIGSQVDVLQCIAASLGLLLFVTWLAQEIGGRHKPLHLRRLRLGDRVWWAATAVLLMLVAMSAPFAANWTNLPIPLRAWMNSSTGSWFPLFPWAGFVFAGAIAGAGSRLGQAARDNAGNTAPSAPLPFPGQFAFFRVRPSAMLVASLPLAVAAWSSRGAHYSSVSPASFLERTAWVLLLAAVCEWLATHCRLPAVVLFAGQRSLTLYVVHLVLISTLVAFGVPAQIFPLAGVLGMILVVGSTSLAVTWCLARFRIKPRSAASFANR